MKSLLEGKSYTVVESFTLPGREAAHSEIPSYLFETSVGQFLEESFPPGKRLWRHQSAALELLGRGHNVVVPTGTASGKSLIFRSAAFHRLLQDESSRVVVFYPLKALASDQMRGWHAMAESLGLPADVVGRIDGSVKPVQIRDEILQRARVVVMTPDVCHAWLMSRLSVPLVKEFVTRLSMVILDEAHTLDGVFGSNFAFLMRRLLATRQQLQSGLKEKPRLQFVAASATISNATAHLEALCGTPFELVEDTLDGSPRFPRLCAHVAAPEGEELEVARALQTDLLSHSGAGGFITFVDSRKGVEILARQHAKVEDLLEAADVLPYRAGYDARDRQEIEQRLQRGTLRGVVSTSALELGIDLPHLTVGINVNVPATRKAYRQRLGRIGRVSEGVFVVIAPPDAFVGYGTTFREYHDLSVEESYLYLDNRFMQFAHARCLADEIEAIGVGGALPSASHWPTGFGELFAWAKPGGNRPPAYDAIAQLGADSPQHGYPLRNVGEINFRIAQGEGGDAFGEINESQALRECYPGATYLHLGRPWEVVSWRTNAFMPYIKVKPASPRRLTRPRIRTWINAGITAADLMEQHLLQSELGFLAECQMQVTEKVEGYEDLSTGIYRSYGELRQQNPNMRPRTRNFRTSGVILSISAPWFSRSSVKHGFADRLQAVFAREYSVMPQDVGSAGTNISVRSSDGGGPRSDCIVIFDQTYGSLRLTERVFLNFDHLMDRLARGSAIEGIEQNEWEQLLQQVRDTVSAFNSAAATLPTGTTAPAGRVQAFKPGARVFYREKGKVGTEVEIIQPTIMSGQLMYQVKCPPPTPNSAPVRQWVSAASVEPSAEGDWEYGSWDPTTESFDETPSNGPTQDW